MYSYLNSKEYLIQFVNAFDILEQQKIKLFGIPEIDNLLNLSEKKNLCIVDRSTKNPNFLYSLFAQFCIDFCFSDGDTIDIQKKQNKTILIDAGNGNNLGYMHQNLIEKSIKTGFKINKVLDNIIITRAFTFYQLANIIIKEIPQFMNNLDCKIQIIVIDLLETLLPSSSSSSSSSLSSSKRFKTNGKNNNKCSLKKDFYENANLLEEIIDSLIYISDKHFVIVSYNDVKDLARASITSKFKNVVNINVVGQNTITKVQKYNKDKIKLKLKISSQNVIDKEIVYL